MISEFPYIAGTVMAKVHGFFCESPDAPGALRALEAERHEKGRGVAAHDKGFYTSVSTSLARSSGTIGLACFVASAILVLTSLSFRGLGPAGLTIPAGMAISIPYMGVFAAVWNREEYSEWLEPGTTSFYVAFIGVGGLYTAACA